MDGKIDISDRFDEPAQPVNRRLIIGATPRSGSNRLSEILFRLGLGVPAEYFNTASIEHLASRFGLSTERMDAEFFVQYLKNLEKVRTRNGVFAVKLFTEHKKMLDNRGLSFPDAFTIVLKRRKKSEQVVSFVALLKTKSPYDSNDKIDLLPDPISLDENGFLFYAKYLSHNEKKWENHLKHCRGLSFFMEDFFDDPSEYLDQIVDRGGFDVTEHDRRTALDFARSSNRYAAHSEIKEKIRSEFSDVLKQIADRYDV